MKTIALFMIAFAIQSSAGQERHIVPENQKRVQVIQPVTGEQVEQILAGTAGQSDAVVAKQLYSLEPVVRFGPDLVERCQAHLAGPESKRAFTALADQSLFLSLPVSKDLSPADPDFAAQKEMIARTTEYVANTLHHLPNFYASRTTSTFTRKLRPELRRFRFMGKRDATIYYRDGDEVVRSEGKSQKTKGLTTRGEFGPILATAMVDAVNGNLGWDRWEQKPFGQMAVFTYKVTAANSHFKVDDQPAAYRGEIGIDPADGAVHRIVLKSEMNPLLHLFSSGSSLEVADLQVDYGPVDLGGKTYICPVKGVALSQDGSQIWLNDIVFDDYHLFRGDTRILTGFEAIQ